MRLHIRRTQTADIPADQRAAAVQATIASHLPVRHRYDISTTDFTDAAGTAHPQYSVLSYGTSAQDAADRALGIIALRWRPAVMPTVTAIRCDMGCMRPDDSCLKPTS